MKAVKFAHKSLFPTPVSRPQFMGKDLFSKKGDSQGHNSDCEVESLAQRRKPKRNEQLERFCDAGIFINMSTSNPPEQVKIGKQALPQGFSSLSRRHLHNLSLKGVLYYLEQLMCHEAHH